jgi:hypothetical protein
VTETIIGLFPDVIVDDITVIQTSHMYTIIVCLVYVDIMLTSGRDFSIGREWSSTDL